MPTMPPFNALMSPEHLRDENSHHNASHRQQADLFARILAILCLLNVNGITSMIFDEDALASIFILVSAAILIIYVGRHAWTMPFSFLMTAVASYLALGSIFYDARLTVDDPSQYYRSYGGSLLIFWGVSGYAASLTDARRLESFLRFLRHALLISAASVWFSPVLYKFYTNLPFSFEQRMGGFFGNPNEAAMVSVLAVALTLEMPFRNRLIQFLALTVASVAIVMTFSKTGMTCLVVVLAWSLMRNARGIGVVLLPLATIAMILLIQNPESILRSIADSPVLQLDTGQKGRIMAIGDILGGQIDEETTTGRTYLWQVVTQRAWDNFPFGSGLGSAHHIVGGLLELGVWQGAHNSFLMMWGESGVLPVLLLAIAMGAAIACALRHPLRPIALTTLVILIVDMMVTHNTLSVRYHNMMLSVVLGLVAIRPDRIPSRRGRLFPAP